MNEDMIKKYTNEWLRLLFYLKVQPNEAPITLYEFIKLREGNY